MRIKSFKQLDIGAVGRDNLKWWTVGESNSRLSHAKRLHCPYANGPG
jgi:hypothetical protein